MRANRNQEGSPVIHRLGAPSTRPLCPYPQVAVDDRRGDPDEAASFPCEVLSGSKQ
jgi:hypothetical protein